MTHSLRGRAVCLQWPLLPVSTKEPLSSHGSADDSGHFPEKAEMMASVTLAGNGPARLDLLLAMLFFFSPSATFNKCATVFNPLTTTKSEIR